MKLKMFQVDAFTNRLFGGNPAAVVPLEDWLSEATMQAIAAENNLSETAFIVPEGNDFGLRWFTPAVEVDLCGHATLATAHVIFTELDPSREVVHFHTRSGRLTVTRDSDRLSMDFPSRKPVPVEAPPSLISALGAQPAAVLKSRDFFVVFETEAEVRALTPDFPALGRLDTLGIIVTAKGDTVDFVSRFFAPYAGINEDPVTGSAHCTLIPYWSERLGKTSLHALQVSRRGGELFVEDRGERVKISGNAVTFLRGEIEF
ncbi:MAG: PhzF family phenazine biosynthesis protein [Acidobacteria bacterium]|nr:PhzF family phenazine biosynthesis protein [Acidobacteriota bacterium]